MSKACKNDEINTKSQLKNFNPIENNKTWLGHIANKESGLIDVMVLEKKYSIDQMITKLKSNPNLKPKSDIKWEKRVNDHILHLSTKDGDSRNRAEDLNCHNLNLIENEEGKISFNY